MIDKNYLYTNVKSLEQLRYFSNLPMVFYGKSVERITDLELIDRSFEYADFKYNINQYGFRGDFSEILNTSHKKIGFFGCSVTFGQAVPEEHIFVKLVEKHFNSKFKSFNFGTIGGSFLRMGKLLNAVTNFIELDYAVFLLPSKYRFLIYNGQDKQRLFELIPSLDEHGYPNYNGTFAELFKYFDDDNFTLFQLDYVGWMIDRCLSKNIIPLFSSWDAETYNLLNCNVSKNFMLDLFTFNFKEKKLLGRDNGHPGIVPHRLFANNIITKIK